MLATRHREKIVEHAEVKILSIRQEAHIDRLCEVSMKIFPSFEKPLATLMINKPFYRASGEYIGAGTLIRASIWAGDEIIGYLSVDNKLSLKPFVDHDCELLALYASILGHLYSRKKAEVKLHEADRQIKKEVTDRKQVEEAKSESEKAEQRFRQRLTALIEVGNELSEIDSFDDLCRQAVELG
ncbi:MAG: hypothetical protein JSV03_17615, partial [Planctomycetota bacterium]